MITILGALVLLAAVFIPLEKVFAAVEQPVIHRATLTDLAFFFGQNLLWAGLIIAALSAISLQLGAPLSPVAARLPWGLQAVLVVLLGDLVVYWAHRASHRFEFLWRFHRVHHTAERMDWLAAHREHPIDGLWTQLWLNLPAILLGFPLATIAGVAMFRGLWGTVIHSNTRLRLGPVRFLIGAPSLHHWHHELHRSGRCNFANLCPLMDVIFGTFYEPSEEPEQYGVLATTPRSYLGLLLAPLLPMNLQRCVPAVRLRRPNEHQKRPDPTMENQR